MITWILVTAAAIGVTFAVSGIFFTGKTRKKVSFMLDAIEDNDTNFRFREDKGRDRKFNRTLNRLRHIFEKEKALISEQEKYYGQMLDCVRTGIVVIENNGDRVEYCNAAALSLLGIVTFSNLKQLRRINPMLAEAFAKVTDGHEERAAFSNEASQMTFSMTASSAELQGKSVKIVAFNDISSDIEENEAASWNKLIRVLTHEIMNTVTPIASLSEALAAYMSENGGGETCGTPDIKAGLETIAASSRGLIRFVDSYRNLTHIAAPVKKAFFLNELIQNVFNLTENDMRSKGVRCTYSEKSEDILLYADMGQISQILINMLKNAC